MRELQRESSLLYTRGKATNRKGHPKNAQANNKIKKQVTEWDWIDKNAFSFLIAKAIKGLFNFIYSCQLHS